MRTPVAAIIVLIFSAHSTPAELSRGRISELPGSTSERAFVEIAMKTENPAATCSARIQSFVEELEAIFPYATSVYPVQALFKKYFPIEGCDPDQVLAICQRSKYCSDQSAHPSLLTVVFDSRPNEPHSGLYVQFSVERKSGDTQLPFVKIKI
jgi:hypothetical protein